MKNKKATYLLLFVVLILWGFIGFKLFRTINPSEEKAMNGSVGSVLADTRVTDTFSIIASYRDPFFNHHPVVGTERKVKQSITVSLPVIPKQPVRWPDVQFMGTISNNKLAKKVAIVRVNGKENMMKAGESLNELKLLNIVKDSVQFSFMGEKKYFKKSY